ncbi:exosortase-dependent surface protein XDP2 [Anabaena sp. UHCC 0399]|uniref:exosortase-dependent surface protein XDP2 n=1 Tax=Anabaena sp. UHCC 0399 TaxID=3110238 RepID=UPI002B1F99F3|nr:exosortase-dependent surface protein XDP2 [Anabaena sp. UHCC 0399]MEA5564019.1 exosortase-dependent surface protein XDP2 [Anabaena sp. UHCC 0399]
MKVQNILTSAVVALSAALAMSSTAKAASFITNFTPNPANPQEDIFLTSIQQGGQTLLPFTNLLLVNDARINFNTPKTSVPNSGAASTDRGELATNPLGFAPNEDPTGAEIAAYLGNYNLNNIVDSEDTPTSRFDIDVFFEAPVIADSRGLDSFFFFERGLNSDIQLQAIDINGNLVGSSYKITRGKWTAAGYSMDTTEVPGAQPVGSWGVSYADLGLGSDVVLSGLKLISESSFNGPDFKVFATASFCCGPIPIPEPTTIIGLGAVAGLTLVRRRQMKTKKI